MMIAAQIFIFLFGGSAVWLVGRTEKWRRWGYISGFCGGPFWLYVAASNNQWGIFALSLWYSYSWAQGINNYWIKPWREKKKIKPLDLSSYTAAGVYTSYDKKDASDADMIKLHLEDKS